MKEDFRQAKEELQRLDIDIIRICRDFYHREPIKRGARFFTKSPKSSDRNPSLCLYAATGTFKDYSSGKCGDVIGFLAYVRGISNWEALQELRAAYGLSENTEQREELQRKIRLQEARERRKKERRESFRQALVEETDEQKRWEWVFRTALERKIFEPFSDMWEFCIRQLQRTEHRLDVLAAIDEENRSQWLRDVLAILRESGRFTATDAEVEELLAGKVWW